MMDPKFCTPNCKYLSPTEAEQDTMTIKGVHMCGLYGVQVFHGRDNHPDILKCDECRNGRDNGIDWEELDRQATEALLATENLTVFKFNEHTQTISPGGRQMDKFWMVVNIAQRFDVSWNGGERISAQNAPKYMHYSREAAENELLRLQKAYPNGTFVLLEAVAAARERRVLIVEELQ